MALWTKCPIKVSRLYGGERAQVFIPDKRSAREWGYSKQEVDAKYATLLEKLKTQFIILFTTLETHGEEWLARTFKNGLVMQYPFTKAIYAYEKKQDPQLHVYPLIMLPWFQKKYRQEKPENDPIMFVDGKIVKWTKDVCFNCPQMLDRSLRQCGAVHESCTRPLVSDTNPPTQEWIDAHATATDNIEGFTFKPIKEMALIEAFEPFTIYSLTSDEAKVKELQEKRSVAATTAAQSRFVQDVACKQCLRKKWCGGFRRGGSYCRGLHITDDYDYLHEKCEPWMAHVMLLTQHEPIDAKLVSSWKGTKTPAYVLRPVLERPFMDRSWAGEYENDPRSVVMMRGCHDNPSVTMPYRHACKLLNVTPVSKWNELPPSYSTSRSLRAVAYGLASGRIHSRTSVKIGWGSRSVEIVSVRFEAGRFAEVSYDNNRHNSRSRYRVSEGASFYNELLDLPGMYSGDGATFSAKRTLENAVFHEAVLERRFNVTIDEVGEACRTFSVKSVKVDTHLPAVYDWLEERSKERCRQKRRSSKQPASSTPGDQTTAT